MLYVLYGGDVLAIRKRVASLREEADGGTGMLEANLTLLDVQQATAEAILAASMAVPFLAPRRVVIADGLLDRFAGGRPSPDAQASGPSSRQGRGVAAFQPLLDILERDELPPSTDLIVTGLSSARSDRNSLLTRLKRMPNSSIEEMKPPQRAELFRFVREEGAARGIRWQGGGQRSGGDPVARLAERLQSDTLAIANELDKLALYTMGREATLQDVDDICSGEKESTAFNLVDALMDGHADSAAGHLAQLRSKGANTQGMLGLITSSYRRLGIIQDHLDDGASPDDIGKAIGLPWPRLRDAAIARARRHGLAGIRKAYELVIDADRRIKLGDVDEDLAVDILVFSLAAIAPVPQRRQRSGTGASGR